VKSWVVRFARLFPLCFNPILFLEETVSKINLLVKDGLVGTDEEAIDYALCLKLSTASPSKWMAKGWSRLSIGTGFKPLKGSLMRFKGFCLGVKA
jgi:hypothetical protein